MTWGLWDRPQRRAALGVVSAVFIVGLSSCGGSVEAVSTYGSRFAEYDQSADQPLIVPVVPPPGYALSPALDPDVWVPTRLEDGRVPMVTLCVLGEGVEPAGVCFGTNDQEKVAFEESIVDLHRLVVVASSSDSSAAAEMLDDWRSIEFTSRWEDVGWLDEASEIGP